jgi:Ca2+-binding EF-hand superfamily protein
MRVHTCIHTPHYTTLHHPGYYPTEQEVQDIKTEIRYSHYYQTGDNRLAVDLGEFVRLYVNHRPVFGISRKQFEECFEALGVEGGDHMTRVQFIKNLESLGERMGHAELAECVDALMGSDTEKDPLHFLTTNEEESDSDDDEREVMAAAKETLKVLPKQITEQVFAQDILGFDDY